MTTQKQLSPQHQAVLNNQAAVADTQRQIGSLQSAIAQQQTIITRSRAALPDVAALERERQDKLAAVALGQGTQVDLAALDEQLAARKAETKKLHPKIEQAEQTIAGLERKIEEMRGAETKLREQHRMRLRDLLYAEAEVVGAAYIAAAEIVAESYRNINAIASLLKDAGDSTAHVLLPQGYGRVYLPCFNSLESNKKRGMFVTPQVFFDAESDGRGAYLAWRDAVTKRLRADGIQIGEGS
ncbi:hypothetical protein GNX71_28685 [Variovorax sp. RKNM96]|uniref:hypothetical protein n=1 Tax=Variovorax sp. RKNM96 TaxID=2681552 RepID=UPI001982333F|nr:hypothetical protein [Variovorax sp. RKNM96]QSI33327.1 hypothetical protein GNX71_28685 [Variovorax sp. RKNM96]